MSTISIIAAIADKSAIGKNQQLLCHMPSDMKRFKELTTGHAVIMGRKTVSPCSATAQSEECRIDDYARGWFRELFRLRVYGGRSGFM